MIIPEWTTGNLILYGLFAALVVLVGPLEYFGMSMMAYSKFRPSNGIPSRFGMTFLYFAPLVALIISAESYLSNPTMIQLIVFGAVFIHFGKRMLESLLLHRYSGPMGVFTTLMIAGFYSLLAFIVGWLNQAPLQRADIWFYLGVVIFIAGIVGNFNHHRVLAGLRKKSLEYKIPSGGLFDHIVCPHYLFEMLTWVGIFLLSRHLGAFLAMGFVAAYLTARSIRTLAWYRETFRDFPSNRKALIPFIL